MNPGLTLVAARARGGAIGKDNTLPWHCPDDLRAFKEATRGAAIIMGRRTMESLPRFPLPERMNIVISRHPDKPAPGGFHAASLDQALELAAAHGIPPIVIGGAMIYRAALPLAQRMLITEIDLDISAADAFFPEFDLSDWQVVCERRLSPIALQRDWRRQN